VIRAAFSPVERAVFRMPGIRQYMLVYLSDPLQLEQMLAD
jgi:hypothetical protein